MSVAADAASTGPTWVIIVGFVVTIFVAIVAARGPVWLERAKAKFGKHTKELASGAEKTATGEAILREWLEATIGERDRALREVDRLEKRINKLTVELHRLGWDGRTV